MGGDGVPQELTAVPEAPADTIYTSKELSKELRQGEIISDLTQYIYDAAEGGAASIVQPYVVVATQDCDLLQDYKQSGTLNGVLLFEAQPAPAAKGGMPPGRDIWKRVYNNKDERYHYLEKIPPDCDCVGEGLPDLVIDFKRCFTVSPRSYIANSLQASGPSGVVVLKCHTVNIYKRASPSTYSAS